MATRTELVSAEREGDVWRATLSGGRTALAKIIVNAAGPWVAEVLGGRLRESSDSRARLINGGPLLVPTIWDGQPAYLPQQPAGRTVFRPQERRVGRACARQL